MLNYMQNVLRLVSVMTVSDQEALAMANMFTKPALVLLNPNSKIVHEIDKNLLLVFLEQLTNQSCYFAQNSAQLVSWNFNIRLNFAIQKFDFVLMATNFLGIS